MTYEIGQRILMVRDCDCARSGVITEICTDGRLRVVARGHEHFIYEHMIVGVYAEQYKTLSANVGSS